MPRVRYAKKRLWRWRGNPLRRRDDLVEAWIVPAAWTVFAVGGTVAALVTAHGAYEMFAEQRAERQSARATLLNAVPISTPTIGGTPDHKAAAVRWTASDGSTRTGRTQVNTGLTAGSTVTVWQDRRGRLTAAPLNSTDAAIESGFLGAASASAPA
ncbi:Rv1733c family protein [Streptomyces sp. NBC_00358]|uniref:Rv1733c family protein n=1 Tax=Streptomyces sp. NBC_00358 TaxID=2975725 RepID=UPI002E264DB1